MTGSRDTEAPRRPRGSPMLIVLMIIVVLPSVLLADAWGAGAAGIIGGLTGMFSLVAFLGGPLRADLRVAAVLGPLLVVAAAVPRLVAEQSRPAAIALVVVLTFVAGLLPLVGPRFANAGMGLGMTTMFGYGYAPQGGADHRQVLAAAVAGVAVAVVLRVLMGIADPSKATRGQVADVLVADDPSAATAAAFSTWLTDGRQRWLADALDGASRYRLALRTLELAQGADAGAGLRDRAGALATALRAKPRRGAAPSGAAPAPGPGAHDEPVAHADPAAHAQSAAPGASTGTAMPAGSAVSAGPGAAAAADAARALDAVEQAARSRDTSAVRLERDRRHQLQDAVLHPSDRLRSVQVRHALRTALAVLLMLLVTSRLERGDPLVSTVLLATFSILQASWRDTAVKARNKVVGVAAGSVTVAVVLLVVPSRYLTLVAVVALCLGLWYIVTRPAFGSACMVVVSVGFNSVTRHLDPTTLLLQYVGLTLCAVVVGLVLGFSVIPGFRPPALRRRIADATAATATALRAAADGGDALRPAEIALFRDAVRLQDELVPDRERLDDRQLAELDALRTGLRDLTSLADAADLTPDEVTRVLHALGPEDPALADGPGTAGGGGTAGGAPAAAVVAGGPGTAAAADGTASAILLDLAQQVGDSERYLLRTLPAGT